MIKKANILILPKSEYIKITTNMPHAADCCDAFSLFIDCVCEAYSSHAQKKKSMGVCLWTSVRHNNCMYHCHIYFHVTLNNNLKLCIKMNCIHQ